MGPLWALLAKTTTAPVTQVRLGRYQRLRGHSAFEPRDLLHQRAATGVCSEKQLEGRSHANHRRHRQYVSIRILAPALGLDIGARRCDGRARHDRASHGRGIHDRERACVRGLLVIGGAAQAFEALRATGWRSRALLVFIALVYLAGGSIALYAPVAESLNLTLFIVATLLVAGILRAVMAFQMWPVRGWGWVLVGGVMSLLLGIAILVQCPVSARNRVVRRARAHYRWLELHFVRASRSLHHILGECAAETCVTRVLPSH